MTCGFGVVLRSAGPSLPVVNGIFVTHSSLSLLPYEKLPAAICFFFPPRVPGSLLRGPIKRGFMPSRRVRTGGGTWKVGVRLELSVLRISGGFLCCAYTIPPRPGAVYSQNRQPFMEIFVHN